MLVVGVRRARRGIANILETSVKLSSHVPPQTSEYPVILSLENHCSVDQQKLMAEHMISILGSALITKPLGEHMPTALPSPEVRVSAQSMRNFTLSRSLSLTHVCL